MNATLTQDDPIRSVNNIPASERPSVLVADDSPKVREILIGSLRELGIEPIVATKASEAIRLAGQLHPDLILLDGLLPEMHGFEVARFIRHFDKDYRPRIAIITAVYKNLRYENEARLRYGVDAYLVKPVTIAQLASEVQQAKHECA